VVSVIAARPGKWSGWPAGGSWVLELVHIVWAPCNGRESKRFVSAGYVNQKVILFAVLTGELDARPTEGLYM
jgi:hypothetical protein